MDYELILTILGVILIPITMGTVWETYQIRKERRREAMIAENDKMIVEQYARERGLL